MARVIDILLRHGKNNPVLVGDAGVGKTAIAEALAQRIAAGEVPTALKSMRLLALDHVALLAGTQFRGQYEERVQGVVDETTSQRNVILFIDELHNLMGQGVALGAAMDAANMLKPALVRGDFRVVGATTGAEFDRWIRGDSALERRFQQVLVREPGAEDTLLILRVRQETLERHHDVVIHDSALQASVRLTDLFMPDRRRPDRALDALDEACAHMQGATRLTPDTERLAAMRRAMLRAGPVPPPPPASEIDPGASSVDPGDRHMIDLGPDIQFELPEFARDGFAALERIGAELGSLFEMQRDVADAPQDDSPDAQRDDSSKDSGDSSSAAPDVRASGQEPPVRRTLASVEAELRDRLTQEGVVVRGHDVARVMTQITGKQISWVD